MKRTLIALTLALGATAAVAEPTLDLQSAQAQSIWQNAPEATAYRTAPIVDDNAADYPFNP
ncbi:MAG: hypothetical protein ACM36B_04525 [Bacteroidota bacterium]